MKNSPEKVVVMGAGPAGLSTAWALARRGVQVDVVEADSEVGGMCKTIRRNGFMFDLGGHRFLTQYPRVLKEVTTLMGDDMVVCPRKSTIRLRGKYFQYPLDGRNLLLNMNPFVTANCMLDYTITAVKNRLRPPLDVSLKDWVTNRFGKELYDIYFGPYTEKLWGMSPSEISADWAAQRITLLNLWDVLLRLLGKKTDTPKTYATEFYYPMRGIGELYDRMSNEIVKLGGTVRTNAPVTSIETRNGKIQRVAYGQNGSGGSTDGEHFVCTFPLPDCTRVLTPGASNKALASADELSFRSLVFLNLALDMGQISDNTWMYFPEPSLLFFRLQEPRNWHPNCAPPGKTSLILEIACSVGDDIWNASPEALLERAVEDLRRVDIDVRGKVIDYFTTAISHAYPVYALGYKECVQNLRSEMDGLSNLTLTGRQGLYRYLNMDHCIQLGFIVEHILLDGAPKTDLDTIGEGPDTVEKFIPAQAPLVYDETHSQN